VSVWCGCGVDVVWLWCGCGVDVVSVWCGCRVDVVWMWCRCGVDVVWLWCGCGVGVVWLWCGCGCGVVVVWVSCGCGVDVVWLWCRCGVGVVWSFWVKGGTYGPPYGCVLDCIIKAFSKREFFFHGGILRFQKGISAGTARIRTKYYLLKIIKIKTKLPSERMTLVISREN